ncbi:DUF6545 domain-containing protein [Streptomyces sp. NBC_00624]|uniref:DUF6545 domain-containing protein n=1 Tax=Streptomyces sp. NBC_00624 TaxID=2975791 RepID=UPI002F916B91
MWTGAVTTVNIVIAALSAILGIVKGVEAWRHEKELTLKLAASVLLFAAVIFLLATPWVYRAVGALVHSPNISALIVPAATLVCVAHAHVMTQLWHPERRAPAALRRTAMIWAPVYAGAIILMVVLYVTADLGPATPLRFAAAYAHVPQIVLFHLVYFTALITTIVECVRQCRSMSLPGRPDFVASLGRSIGYFVIALVLDLVNVAISTTAMIGAAMGNHRLAGIADLAWSATIASCLAATYGLGRMMVPARLEEHRDGRALRALWKSLMPPGDSRELILAPRTWRSGWETRVTVRRRVTEVRDLQDHLSPWWSVEPGLAVERLTKDLSGPSGEPAGGDQVNGNPQAWDAVAAKAAATLLYAAQLRDKNAPVPLQERLEELPGLDVPIPDERPHLVRVARHMTHPVVLQAVALATRHAGSAMPV